MSAPKPGPCYRCGKNPAEGYASIWTAKDGERWYCHGDDENVSCYETTGWDADGWHAGVATDMNIRWND